MAIPIEKPGLGPSLGPVPLAPKSEKPINGKVQEEKDKQVRTARVATGVGLAALAGLGIAMKDGLKSGFHRIADVSNALSNIISIPVTLLFPGMLLAKEFNLFKHGKKGSSENAALFFYPLLSLAFTPKTWGEPLKEATKSKLHMFSTLINMPHLLFSLFSYTGGRAMSLLKIFEMYFKKGSAVEHYRLEEERKAFHRLGNFGSNHCSVIPLASQSALGLLNLRDIAKGDFGSVWQRFKHEPIATTLGTLFHWFTFPFDYVSKILDTIPRACETVHQWKYAFGKNSKIPDKLVQFADKWHKTSQDGNSILGKSLKYGREFAKIEALLVPPLGMLGIVTTMFDPYFRGEFFNKRAQERGGIVGLLDKVFCSGAFLMHLYYTTAYSIFTRLPQTITTSTFYVTNLINKIRGIDLTKEGYEKNPRYIDPATIRDRIFNRSFITKLSNWAARKLNKIEKELHPDKPNLITEDKHGNLTENCSLVGNYETAFASNECYIPIKEELFHQEIMKEYADPYLEGGFKEKGKKPSEQMWSEVLKQNKPGILAQSSTRVETYLREIELFSKEDIKIYMESRYEGVKKALEKLIDKEIDECKTPSGPPPTEKLVAKSKTFLDLFKHPKEAWEVLKLRTFHNFFTYLPASILNFVKVVDFGKPGESFRLRNHVATYTGINIGDNELACNLELTPVYANALKNFGLGASTVADLITGNVSQAFFDGRDYSNVDYKTSYASRT